jgi:hypothetical protein
MRLFYCANKKGGELLPNSSARKPGFLVTPNKDGFMIIYVVVKLKEIFKKGRDYPWQKPECCPNCNRFKVWGHGFVSAFFDGFQNALEFRRYRCPDCKCVIRLRPREFFPRFQAPIDKIRSSISERLYNKRWLPHISRTRQAHWYKALKRRVLAHLGNNPNMRLEEAFDYFIDRGVTPVSRSI